MRGSLGPAVAFNDRAHPPTHTHPPTPGGRGQVEQGAFPRPRGRDSCPRLLVKRETEYFKKVRNSKLGNNFFLKVHPEGAHASGGALPLPSTGASCPPFPKNRVLGYETREALLKQPHFLVLS